MRRGEKAGFPRFKGRDRWHSFTFHSFTFHSFTCKEYGNGAALDNGLLVLSKIGRLRVQLGASVSIGAVRLRARPRGHDQQRSGRLVRLLLLRRRADTALARDRAGSRHRLRARILRHAQRWHAHPHARLLPQGRALSGQMLSGQMPASDRQTQEGQPAQAQGSLCPGKSLSDGTPGTPPASGLPSQDSASTDPELILN